MRDALLARWEALGARLVRAARGDADAWAEEGRRLLDAWAEPHRAYHTVRHLDACLRELDTVRDLAREPDVVELALWYHDAVYDPLAPDNEARSAGWAVRALHALGLKGIGARVGDLVLATRHDAVPEDPDAALLVDVDLAILGRPPEVYDAYERAVRAEYGMVPDALYVAGRGGVLDALLARPRIYTTPAMAERYEAQARANLARARAALAV